MGIGERVEGLLGLVRAQADEADRQRRPSSEVMRAFAEAGLLKLLVPEVAGGPEIGLADFVRVVERVARVHGSTAWTVMTCNEEAGIAASYLPSDRLARLYRAEPSMIVAGSGVPKGTASAVGDGWIVDGRWDFVSGCTSADRLILSNLVADQEPARFCFALVDASAVTIEDTWHTVGLRGTGSNDVVLASHHVDGADAALSDPDGSTVVDAAFYRLPAGLRFPFPKVGVATGLARAAIDEFVALAEGKRPLFAPGSLRQRPTAQLAMAQAEASLGAGRAWAFEMLDRLWAVVVAGDEVDEALHARCRLACSHAVSGAIAAVEVLAAEAGTTANGEGAPLATLLADVRAVAGHFTVAPYQKATAGRHLLGLERQDPRF